MTRSHILLATGSWFLRARIPCFITGVILIGGGLLQLPHYRWVLGSLAPSSIFHPGWLFGLGLAFVAVCFLISPHTTTPHVDCGSTTAKLWLAIILVVAALIRFYEPLPAGLYWDDWAIEAIEPRNIMDYGEHHLLFPFGNREPMYSYALATIWSLIPDSPGPLAQRLANVVLDLGAVWLSYLLAKEAAGRRAGLLLASMVAINKSMVIQSLAGMRVVTVPVVVTAVLLFSFRLFKKKDLSHFVQWGTVLGFSGYSYPAVRPLLLFLVLSTACWILTNHEERRAGPWAWILVTGTSGFWAYLFVDRNGFMPPFLTALPLQMLAWIFLSVCVLLIWSYRRVLSIARKCGHGRIYLGWVNGLICASLLLAPLAIHPGFAARVLELYQQAPLSKQQNMPGVLAELSSKALLTLRTLIIGGRDRDDMNLPGDSFFDFHSAIFVILGLTFAIVRPSWKKTFLLASTMAALIPHILSNDPHSGKLMPCVTPLLLLGTIAVDHALSMSSVLSERKFLQKAVFVMTVGFIGWAAWSNYTLIHDRWATKRGKNATVARQVFQDSKTNRVYLAYYPDDQFLWNLPSQTILNDGVPVYYMHQTNPICLAPSESVRDVVILVSERDVITQERIRGDFPKSQWVRMSITDSPDFPAMYRVLVPKDQISESTNKLLYIRHVSENTWKRTVYGLFHYGIARGIIQWEDRVMDVKEPYPRDAERIVPSVKLEGSFINTSAEEITFKTTTLNDVRLSVAGRMVFDLRPKQGETSRIAKRIFLGKGSHKVEIVTYLFPIRDMPAISYERAGGIEKDLFERKEP